jgi:hypothetical protein
MKKIVTKFEVWVGIDKEPRFILSQLQGQKLSLILNSDKCPERVFISEYNATVRASSIMDCEPSRQPDAIEEREMTKEEEEVDKMFLALKDKNNKIKLLN